MTDAPGEPLFDDFKRDDDSPRLYSEGTYTFLNRAADERWSKARALLEDWFSHYPEEHKASLRGRLVDSDEGQHLGAWWELFTYSLYRCLGYRVEVIGEVPGKKQPDFLVTLGADSMYVECTVDLVTDGAITTNPGVAGAFLKAIDQIPDRNFLVGLEFKRDGRQQPSRREIIRDIGGWLSTLDADEVLADLAADRAAGELGVLPEKDFEFRDWVIGCTAYPNEPGRRYEGGSLLGALSSPRAFFIRNVERIRDKVSEKGARYGKLGALTKPLVIALLCVDNFADQRDVTEALFGSTHISIPVEGDPAAPKVARGRDGYWRGPGSDRGLRVSAVLFSHNVRPWSVSSHLPAVWIHPWADKPIAAHPPFITFTATDQGLVTEKPSDATPQDVFGPQIT